MFTNIILGYKSWRYVTLWSGTLSRQRLPAFFQPSIGNLIRMGHPLRTSSYAISLFDSGLWRIGWRETKVRGSDFPVTTESKPSEGTSWFGRLVGRHSYLVSPRWHIFEYMKHPFSCVRESSWRRTYTLAAWSFQVPSSRIDEIKCYLVLALIVLPT